MTDLLLRLYEDDDVTVRIEFGTSASHPNPYLQKPESFAEAEIDLLNGRARIGRVNIRVTDPRTGTNAERFVTALLGTPDGHSAINGRRATLLTSGGVVIQDGICAGSALLDSRAGFEFSLEDFRARGINVKAFARTGTATVLPRGVLNGWGRVPGGEWLAPPVEPIRGEYQAAAPTYGAFMPDGRPSLSSTPEEVSPGLIVTDAMLQAGTPQSLFGGEFGFIASAFTQVKLGWRPEGSSGAFTWLEEMPNQSLFGANLFGTRPAKVTNAAGEEASVRALTSVQMTVSGSGGVPNHEERIEVVVVYTGPASEDFPFHFDGTWGEYARNLLRGDYSPQHPRIPYDEAALLAITDRVLIRRTEPVDDLREHLEDLHAAIGAAPALNDAGEVAPVRGELPDAALSLPQLDDTNCQGVAGWEHPITGAVTIVDVTYPRYFRVPAEEDPEGRRSAGDGLAMVEQEVRVRPLDESGIIGVMGEQVHTIDAFPFGAIGGAEGEPASGDVADEHGFQHAYRLGHQLIDARAYGGQSSFVKVMRSQSAAIRVGDWVIDARTWAPNYETGRRGRNHLAQVVSIRDLNPAWREMRLLDAAPYANPVGQPTLGAPTANDDGVVWVPVTAIASGSEARVDYAVSETMPPPTSGLWSYAGRVAAPGAVETPPTPAGATVWIRARGEKEGRRPSAWTVPVTVGVPAVPRVRQVRAVIDADGTALARWEANPFTLGVRVYYTVHAPGDDPVLANYVDADAAAGEVDLPVMVEPGQSLTVEVEPWSGWTGSAVSGTAGTRRRHSHTLPRADETALDLQASPIEVRSDALVYEITAGSAISDVWGYEQVIPVGGQLSPWPAPGERAPDFGPLPVPATLTLPYPPLGFMRYVRLYPLTAALRAGPFVQLEIPHLPPEAPVVEVETTESMLGGVATGTALIRLQERGIAVTSVELQTQVGDEPPSVLRAPHRTAGDTGRIPGERLAAGEWEHDVILHATRLSYIYAWATLETGETLLIPVPPFDRNREPDIVLIDIIGLKAKCTGDSDVKSWRAERLGSGVPWSEERDGSYVTFDVPVPDDDSWSVEFTARAALSANVTSSTLAVSETRMVRGANVDPESGPRLETVRASAPAVASADMELELATSLLPASTTGWSIRVSARSNLGSGWSAWSEITSELSPALGALTPSEAHQSTHAWTSGHSRTSGSLSVTYELRAELLDGSGEPLDSGASQAGWSYGSSTGGGRDPEFPT